MSHKSPSSLRLRKLQFPWLNWMIAGLWPNDVQNSHKIRQDFNSGMQTQLRYLGYAGSVLEPRNIQRVQLVTLSIKIALQV